MYIDNVIFIINTLSIKICIMKYTRLFWTSVWLLYILFSVNILIIVCDININQDYVH